MGVGSHAQAALLPGHRPDAHSRLDGPQRRSGRVQKISLLPGINSRTFQPVASRYTDWTILAHHWAIAQTELFWCLFAANYYILQIRATTTTPTAYTTLIATTTTTTTTTTPTVTTTTTHIATTTIHTTTSPWPLVLQIPPPPPPPLPPLLPPPPPPPLPPLLPPPPPLY